MLNKKAQALIEFVLLLPIIIIIIFSSIDLFNMMVKKNDLINTLDDDLAISKKHNETVQDLITRLEKDVILRPKKKTFVPAAASGAGKSVTAPVAGTLLRYAVSEGASVTPDTTVIIIESMKMELEIKAGAAGKIHFIAATGSQIAQGATLAEVQ